MWKRRLPRCNQSVTEGAWGPAVNWVKRRGEVAANMTQYRVNARNCEAKRLHIVASTEPNVACEYAHVGAARQHETSPKEVGAAAACPYTLGGPRRTMANCNFTHSLNNL